VSLNEAQLMKSRLPNGLSLSAAQDRARRLSRVVIVRTLWYPEILAGLETSAREYLGTLGVPAHKIQTVEVPGSFELPLGVQQEIEREPTDFVISLGCIVRGGTPHFDYVSRAAVDGLMKVSLEKRIPVGLGVLTVDDLAQAQARLEKGAEAAQAAFFLWLQSYQAGRGA